MELRNYFSLFCLHQETQLIFSYLPITSHILGAFVNSQVQGHKEVRVLSLKIIFTQRLYFKTAILQEGWIGFEWAFNAPTKERKSDGWCRRKGNLLIEDLVGFYFTRTEAFSASLSCTFVWLYIKWTTSSVFLCEETCLTLTRLHRKSYMPKCKR